MGPPVTAAATFCATLADEAVRAGIAHVMLAPGSRSTPLALALASRPELRLHVFHDERSASFAALGVGSSSERLALVVSTSGTAAAEMHAAVVEAHQAEIPLVLCTADRPPELREVAAPQTIDQIGLYGAAVRFAADLGVPDEAMAPRWRSMVSRALADAAGPWPGPVHLNLPFRDPLVGVPDGLPPGRPDSAPWHRVAAGRRVLDPEALDALAGRLDQPRGLIVAGAGAGDPGAVHDLAAAAGWPVLADPRSGCRLPRPHTVATFDDLLRHPGFASDHTPSVVLRLGRPPASKMLAQWLAASGADQVQVTASAAWVDPEGTAGQRLVVDPSALCRDLAKQLAAGARTPWAARWRWAEERAQHAIASVLADARRPTEPGVARALVAALPAGATLVASSSMPVRDVEWYSAPRDGLRHLANRGANGIDGVVSTAVGVALASAAPTALLIGDVALLHDSNGLLGLSGREADLTIVVVDNDGGGIFSFLPQAAEVERDRFEQLFGTPHGTDLNALAAAHGLPFAGVDDLTALAELVGDGPRLLRVSTDRAENVAVHQAIHGAVAEVLTGA
ncbi:MAG TPA: 2-succinyl-5-enolpyruvyl-6-hydroxy-3-cyclohexene-1-carboxylic-acid synthase [Acidimicrobiales bacterium]|nr:2-succinyl-5-enolpyruvyl-6-hydroxy-3-cyclohexene-1-carboxylic-acid synthase [Acidimicrobiales bacterium]